MEKNLDATQALKKLKELIEEVKICMFITNTTGDAKSNIAGYINLPSSPNHLLNFSIAVWQNR